MDAVTYRLTQYAHGGGCACKIPPGELEAWSPGWPGAPRDPAGGLLVGLDNGDDAAAVRIDGGTALIADDGLLHPVVDDPYDWGRIAAANALSDVYAMGGTAGGRGQPAGLAARRAAVGVGGRGAARRAGRRGLAGCHWPAATASTTPNRSTAWR